MKVLFAEDAPVSRQLVTNILTRQGIELVSVADGEEAWQVLNAPDRPRLLLLDWMMPKLDGIELCQKIRASNWPQYTYIILLTARTQPTDVVAAIDSGIDDYLGKPVAAEDLLARVRIGERALQKEDRLIQVTKAWRAMLDQIPLGVVGLRANRAI
jgi:DNA-binding response OmpR family regulator